MLMLGTANAADKASTKPDLVRNGSFELDVRGHDIGHWEVIKPLQGQTELKPADESSTGRYVRMSPKQSKYPEIHMLQQPSVDNPPTGKYRLAARVRISSDYDMKQPPAIHLNVFNPPSSAERYYRFYKLQAPADSARDAWLQLEQEVTLPEGCPRYFLQLAVYGERGFVEIDDVSITAAP
jgi:hypothetical protein